MARWTEPNAEQLRMWKDWTAGRPDAVRVVAEQFEPWSLYRMKSTGHRVTVQSFNEGPPVTLTVNVEGAYNLVVFDRSVFGIDPGDLEPCELPPDVEVTGTVISPQGVRDNLDALRVMVRPDLWTMDADGNAVRKTI